MPLEQIACWIVLNTPALYVMARSFTYLIEDRLYVTWDRLIRRLAARQIAEARALSYAEGYLDGVTTKGAAREFVRRVNDTVQTASAVLERLFHNTEDRR